MIEIKKFIIEDVRCFDGRQELDIRPLTFLVGENSTGKSTVLGCMQVLADFVGDMRRPSFNFNADPYLMGAFADIARKVGNRAGGRKKSFKLGFEIHTDSVDVCSLVTLIERGSGSEPSVERVEIEFDEGRVVVEMVAHGKSRPTFPGLQSLAMHTGHGEKPVYTLKMLPGGLGLLADLKMYFLRSLDHGRTRARELPGVSKDLENFEKFFARLSKKMGSHRNRRSPSRWVGARFLFPPYRGINFVSFAPVRSKPIRTYNPERDVEDPEGIGMPMTLSNMSRKNPEEWRKLQKKLVEFGENSGLFTDIHVRQLGRSVSNPFQLQFKVRGPKINISDVGYGISQILPVLVRVFTAQQKTTFLVQQPEVHLHPKGQAALCSLLAGIAKQSGHSFVVETHSDYMVKRARIEIMNGDISPDDVSLIYLEPVKNKVKVHNLAFDKNANFNSPQSYKEFFLRESNRVLGFED